MVIRAIAAAALLLVAGLLTAQAAMACSCAPIDPGEALAEADGALTARLLRVDRLADGDGSVSTANPANFVYRTGRVLKGRALQRGRRLVVRSVLSDASCGPIGDVGALTGLFLQREDGRWTSGLCSQTSRGRMLRLGKGAEPASGRHARCG
jgi:hypothetical protein